MKRNTLFLGMSLLLVVSAGCNQKTLDEEVDGICECIQSAETSEQFDNCARKMEVIADQYANDPKSAADVKKRLDECVPN